jgi:hypothetical protein
VISRQNKRNLKKKKTEHRRGESPARARDDYKAETAHGHGGTTACCPPRRTLCLELWKLWIRILNLP